MTDTTINLNNHHGVTDKKSTQARLQLVRKLLSEQKIRIENRYKIEELLLATPNETWQEAGTRALYLLRLLTGDSQNLNANRQLLIQQAIYALETLCAKDAKS